nr:oligopeptide/dipeptide ABC transporter ATP-binding protein [Mesorhizobium sp.]
MRGEVPSPLNPPSGCAFHPRCPLAVERCRIEVPTLMPQDGGRMTACHVRAPVVAAHRVV